MNGRGEERRAYFANKTVYGNNIMLYYTTGGASCDPIIIGSTTEEHSNPRKFHGAALHESRLCRFNGVSYTIVQYTVAQ